ncbi:MAG: hypothetical protein HY749_03105 [Gammaproteobacteria bacterium]|nr:hypothetical protein [Gammaproteobacteria bacterium]
MIGIAIYAILAISFHDSWCYEYRGNLVKGNFIMDYVDNVVLFAGLAPLLLAVYFLFWRSELRVNAIGAAIVILSILLHAGSSAWIAHTGPEYSLVVRVLELTLVLLVIFLSEKAQRAFSKNNKV